MEIISDRRKLNRPISIRPGPVGSIGDVNLQVKLKKSANYLPDRYDKAFSGKNEVWSGSNVSDGMWVGYTSGGRAATTIKENWTNTTPFKTAVGTVIENIIPLDRERIVKTVPLGNYDWDSQKARIYQAKTTGDSFLPLPMGYTKSDLPRGSQYPRILAESMGDGIALPAADVEITDPIFGETGSIEINVPGSNQCENIKMDYTWTPAMNDPLRNFPPPKSYPYRYAFVKNNQTYYDENRYPDIGEAILVVDIDHGYKHYNIRTDPCGGQNRMAKDLPKMKIPKTGDIRREKVVKQKMR